jgi:hypothetical protein
MRSCRRPRGRRQPPTACAPKPTFRDRAAKAYTAYAGPSRSLQVAAQHLVHAKTWPMICIRCGGSAWVCLSIAAMESRSRYQAWPNWPSSLSNQTRQRKTAGIHPVRRHGPVPEIPAWRSWHQQSLEKPPAAAWTLHSLAWRFSPEFQTKTRQVKAGRRASRVLIATDVLVRGPEPSGCSHHRQLRPALGHHPADPARGPGGSHRAAVGQDSCAIPLSRLKASSASSSCVPACAGA